MEVVEKESASSRISEAGRAEKALFSDPSSVDQCLVTRRRDTRHVRLATLPLSGNMAVTF